MEESILMWNRLEGTLRNENQLDKAMQFEIRDPLWMLTRQWQFGEFDGEDTGSAAFVQISSQHSAITGTGSSGNPPDPFDYSENPLEMPLEQEKLLPDLADRLEMGYHWERLVEKRLPPGQSKKVIGKFRNNNRFRFSTGLPDDPDRIHRFQHAGKYSDNEWLLLAGMLSAGKAIDGYALLEELRAGNEASVFLSQPDKRIDDAGREFLDWFARIYAQHPDRLNTWHPRHLEYQPQLVFNATDGQSCILGRDEYYGEGIEWHGFRPKTAWGDGENPPLPQGNPIQSTATLIPSGLRFKGMPAARLWEIEDGNVDFGSIQASSTELNKMIFAEFGLVYSNDWLVAPVRLRSGNMSRITGMIITDIFGKESYLDEIKPDGHWGFFQSSAEEDKEGWIFIANDRDFIHESEPLEKVTFLRDEMANVVWGVEEVVSDPYGGGRDGESLAKMISRYIGSLKAPDSGNEEGRRSSEGWSYKAGTLMPENRIPFIPVAAGDQLSAIAGRREVVLQRAAVPRTGDGFIPVRIRPRTSVLGFRGQPETERPEPMYVFEEEIPKTGIGVSLVWKRARWFGGRTLTWLAWNKKAGSGEIDANFRFDVLKR